VTATDLNGVPNDTTNTSYYVQVDVDKNNDGNFTDPGESGYATGVSLPIRWAMLPNTPTRPAACSPPPPTRSITRPHWPTTVTGG
jgi:hypothetical protein